MYLIDSAPNQTHQTNIDSLREPSNPKIVFINDTIWPLHTNTAPKKHVMAIGFGPHCHTPATTNIYLDSPFNESLQQCFKQVFTGLQVIADNTTANTPLLAPDVCDIFKLMPLLSNLTLKYDTLIDLKTFMIKSP